MGGVKLLFSEEDIARRVSEMALEIASETQGNLTVIGVLRGCFVFVADLVRALDKVGLPSRIELLRLSSYGNSQKSEGDVVLIGGCPKIDPARTVLLIDDIVDTGKSIAYAKKLLRASDPGVIKICTLLDNPHRREVDIDIDYIGFTIPNEFVVGYGIDYAGDYRSLPYIGIVDREEGQ